MADFALLCSGGSVPESEEEQVRVMKAWEDRNEDLGPAIKDGGNPFGPVAKTVSAGGSISDVSGQPLCGYTIVSADPLDAAIEMAEGSPVLAGGGRVHVYERFEVMSRFQVTVRPAAGDRTLRIRRSSGARSRRRAGPRAGSGPVDPSRPDAGVRS